MVFQTTLCTTGGTITHLSKWPKSKGKIIFFFVIFLFRISLCEASHCGYEKCQESTKWGLLGRKVEQALQKFSQQHLRSPPCAWFVCTSNCTGEVLLSRQANKTKLGRVVVWKTQFNSWENILKSACTRPKCTSAFTPFTLSSLYW